MGNKGSNTTTATTAPNPQAAAAYSSLISQAQNVASTPYQAYQGELTAPVNSQQQAGINSINANSNFATPYVQQAAGLASGAANPLTAAQIQQYQNPYINDVVNATQAQFNNQNVQGAQSLTGNAIAQGALGGNRTGVAQANLANQQQLAQAPVIAGLYNQSYNTGLQTAAQQYQQNPLAAANSIANFGISGQNAALSGAGAQLGAGTLQQQTQQAQDTANYGQYQQAQAYPYQQTQWLSGIATGVGSNLGGTSSTTAPAPNQTAQYIGAGLSAASLFMNRGGAVHGYADGGGVAPRQHFADGGVSGTPWSGGQGWIPTIQIHSGSGAPSAPSAPQQPSFDASKFASGLTGLGNKVSASGGISQFNPSNPYLISGAENPFSVSPSANTEAINSSMGVLGNNSGGAFYGPGFARGGGVAGYASGGAPDDDEYFADPDFLDRFGPAVDHPLGEMSRSQALHHAMTVGNSSQPVLVSANGVAPAVAPAQAPIGPPAPDDSAAPIYDDGQGPVRMYGQHPTGNPDALRGTPVPAKPDTDDDPVPPEAVPVKGYAAPGVVPAQYRAPYEITPADYAPPAQSDKSSFGLGWLSPNAKTGLLAAGLGMLTSRSPNLGNAIGEGGLAGLSAYGSAEEKDRKAAQDAQKLSLEAKKAANDLAHQTFTTNESASEHVASQSETARHNQATEKQSAVNADRTKYVPVGSIMSGDGKMHPLVMDQTTGKMVDGITMKPPADDTTVISKGEKPSVSDEDARAVAARYVKTGDRTQLQGLGVSGAARQKVNHYIGEVQKELGISDEELGTRVAEWEGRKAGQRTLGAQDAKMGSAAMEAEGAIKQARGVIERLPRTSFLPLNKMIQGYQSNTLNPDQAELYGRTQAIVNTYSAVMARGANVTTDSARGHAEALLNTAGNPETYNRMLDTMLQEIAMAKNSPARMREFYRKEYGPSAAPPEPGTATAPASGGFTPPPGAIPQTHNGKTYYYDPNTKQPYPGQ